MAPSRMRRANHAVLFGMSSLRSSSNVNTALVSFENVSHRDFMTGELLYTEYTPAFKHV